MSIYKGNTLLAGTQDNRANTDLSNLSTTGNAKFSKVSGSSTGTSTDTISYITIDGVEKKLAGGSGGANIDLSNLSATGQAKFDAKVNKSGDTMTGELKINRSGNFITCKNESIDTTVFPTSTSWTGIEITDKNGYRLGKLESSYEPSGIVRSYLSSFRKVGGTDYWHSIGVEVDMQGKGYFHASSEVLSSMIYFFMPNYGAGISISSGYVAPSNGYVSFWSQGDNGAGTVGKINNADVYLRDVGITAFSRSGAPVGKGQTITFSGGHQKNATFYPCIGG